MTAAWFTRVWQGCSCISTPEVASRCFLRTSLQIDNPLLKNTATQLFSWTVSRSPSASCQRWHLFPSSAQLPVHTRQWRLSRMKQRWLPWGKGSYQRKHHWVHQIGLDNGCGLQIKKKTLQADLVVFPSMFPCWTCSFVQQNEMTVFLPPVVRIKNKCHVCNVFAPRTNQNKEKKQNKTKPICAMRTTIIIFCLKPLKSKGNWPEKEYSLGNVFLWLK